MRNINSKRCSFIWIKTKSNYFKICSLFNNLRIYDFQRSRTERKREKKDDDNKTLCLYYDPFITKGEDIKNNLKNRNYIPIYNNQTSIGFTLYYSNLYNPNYIDENVKEIAIFEIETNETHLPMNERKVIVEMKFSSCIIVRVKNILSGKEVSIKANYYDRGE